MLNWKEGGTPQYFLVDGNLLRRPVDLAYCQMDYFTDKIKKLNRKLPDETTNPLKWLNCAMDRWNEKGKFPAFNFRDISLIETIQFISSLGNSTSFGRDYIDALAIKSAAQHLAPLLRHLVNTSLRTDKWKFARLLPLLKDKTLNRMQPSSYRPIAILPTVSKIVERAAQRQLTDFLETNRLLNNSSHAYRKGMSTTTTLLDLADRLYEAVDEKKISSLMTLDQSAAFDCIPHHILMEKLKVYNLSKPALKWISSYLELRTQQDVVGRAESRMTTVVRGVPQGSVLGPLLYTVFMNEMSETIINVNCGDEAYENNDTLFGTDCKICGIVVQYADDATVHIANRQRQYNQIKLTEHLENLRLFLNSNHMTINMNKTHIIECMIKQKLGKTPGEPPEIQLFENNQPIELITDSSHIRILGMNIQTNLTFNAHLENGHKALFPSLRINLGALKTLEKQLPNGSRNTLARGPLLSRFTYLISIWGGSTDNLVRKALVLPDIILHTELV